MKTLILYDLTGKIWSILPGDGDVPQGGLPHMLVHIPEGATLEWIDVTDPKNHVPIIRDVPEYGVDVGAVKADVDDVKTRYSTLNDELVSTQMALTEIFEMMLGGGM